MDFNTTCSQDYLGMNLNIKEDAVYISQKGYIDALVHEFEPIKEYQYPAGTNLFDTKQDGPDINANDYLAMVMKIMYLAKLTRPDILLATSFLSCFSHCPKEAHWKSLYKIIGYLKQTRNKELKITGDNKLKLFCDASFNAHPDNKGHSGFVVWYGGLIFCSSRKQKVVSRSTFEAEFICLFDAIPNLTEIIEFLKEVDSNDLPVILFEDNAAVLSILKEKSGKSGTNKHLNHKISYVAEQLKNLQVKVTYLESNDMLADVLTKPLQGVRFNKMRDMLLGNVEFPETITEKTK